MVNATDISSQISHYPNVKQYLEDLVKDANIVIKNVGKEFSYPNSVIYNRYYTYFSFLLEYFIRKHLSNKYKLEIEDSRALEIINSERYDHLPRGIRNYIKKCYEVYTDKNTKAIDILQKIRVVSWSHSLYFNEGFPETNVEVNEENLLEVMKYFDNLKYTDVLLKPSLDCKYFSADVHLIFDNDTILVIRTSKFKSLVNTQESVPKTKFFQLILYSFGFYKKTKAKILKFVMYNPLLGLEYTLILNDINYELFENALKMDIDEEDIISDDEEKEEETKK